jgi:hypothetical protein
MRRSLLLALCAAALATAALPPWPLESTVEAARSYAAAATLARPTGLRRADYLDTITKVVGFWTQYQNASGNIIDPYRGEETQYATPCYAFACATALPLLPGLLPNCSAALGAATRELATRTCADGHCVFFMKPVMFAYRLLAPQVDAGTLAAWDAALGAMDPYRDFGFPVSGNWGLVGTLDMLRTTYITKFGNDSWWRAELDFQLGGQSIPDTFTANGMYQDHSGEEGLNPLPYDTFPLSGYLTVMLQEGYNGTWAPTIRELTRRAAWTHMLMQSPFGEVPTGGRSSQHTWNEAVSALAYEVNAVRSAAEGDAGAACLFQRAAHLSHESVRRWQVLPSGRLQIVKNHFDPALRWGFEGYSYNSQYSLLPAAMLAAAYHYADASDAIPECATFADAGGFVFELPEHHLVIANAGGLYVEVETAADPHYESTGTNRVHVDTCGAAAPPCAALGALATLSASPPQEQGGFTYGPWWTTASGASASLGNASYAEVAAATMVPGWVAAATEVRFEVSFVLTSGVVVRQAFALSATNASAPTLSIASSISQMGGTGAGGNFTRFGLQL